MKASGDLDRIDRVTLRAWRVANLVGWWFVGAAIYNVGGVVVQRVLLNKIGTVNVGWQAHIASWLVSVFAATTAGWVIGGRVYRAPGFVGAATVLLPSAPFILLFLALSPSVGALVGVLVVLVFSALLAAGGDHRCPDRLAASALGAAGSCAVQVANQAIRDLDVASGGKRPSAAIGSRFRWEATSRTFALPFRMPCNIPWTCGVSVTGERRDGSRRSTRELELSVGSGGRLASATRGDQNDGEGWRSTDRMELSIAGPWCTYMGP